MSLDPGECTGRFATGDALGMHHISKRDSYIPEVDWGNGFNEPDGDGYGAGDTNYEPDGITGGLKRILKLYTKER